MNEFNSDGGYQDGHPHSLSRDIHKDNNHYFPKAASSLDSSTLTEYWVTPQG